MLGGPYRMDVAFYSRPTYMTGGVLPVYSGRRRFRGGGIFSSIRTALAPIGRQVLQGVKTIAKNSTVRNFAKEVGKRGTQVLANVAVDALQGRNVGEAFKERSRQAALTALTGEDLEPMDVSEPIAPVYEPTVKSSQSSSRAKKQVFALKQNKRTPSIQAVRKAALTKRKAKRLSRAALNRKDLF